MKKITIASLLAFTLLSAQTDITFTKNFTTKIKPDMLTTNINFSIQKQSQSVVTDKLTKISDFIAADKTVKSKGGEYNVNPHYDYDNGKNIQNGYNGNISYNISSKNPKELNKFIRELQRLADKEGMTAAVSSASWSIGDGEQDKSATQIEMLRLDAVLWAQRYASTLSSKISMTCAVAKINFSDNSGAYYPRPMMMKASMVASDSAPTPTQDEQTVSTSANIELVCK